jgi:hypothetical protein
MPVSGAMIASPLFPDKEVDEKILWSFRKYLWYIYPVCIVSAAADSGSRPPKRGECIGTGNKELVN